MFYTYVLLSEKDHNHYIGYTNNIEKRFNEHNKGLIDSTRNRRPFIIVYYEACTNKGKSIQREKYFKSGFGRKYLKNRI